MCWQRASILFLQFILPPSCIPLIHPSSFLHLTPTDGVRPAPDVLPVEPVAATQGTTEQASDEEEEDYIGPAPPKSARMTQREYVWQSQLGPCQIILEMGKWKNWKMGKWKNGEKLTKNVLQRFLQKLKKKFLFLQKLTGKGSCNDWRGLCSIGNASFNRLVVCGNSTIVCYTAMAYRVWLTKSGGS